MCYRDRNAIGRKTYFPKRREQGDDPPNGLAVPLLQHLDADVGADRMAHQNKLRVGRVVLSAQNIKAVDFVINMW